MLELDEAVLSFPNQHTVIVRAKLGTNVDQAVAKRHHEVIANHLGRDYGMIVDRREDYSLAPVSVFEFLNTWPPLKAIAIVTHRPTSATIAKIDKKLSKKPLAIFDSIEDAQHWIDREIEKTRDTGDKR